MAGPIRLLESTSPNGNVHAIVEEAHAAIHFYLFAPRITAFGVKSCWVRNLAPAPDELDFDLMKAGHAPMLPRRFCAHPAGAPRPNLGDLEIVWFEEGDAAALLERDEVLAIIPAWSGTDGFHGLARDCVAESPLAWPLGSAEENPLFERVRRAREWWASWDGNPWPDFQQRYLDVIESVFGTNPSYFAIDGDKWPPKALVRYRGLDHFTLITLGVALRPQPTIEQYTEDPSPYRRIELGLAIDASLAPDDARALASWLSAQSALPWEQHTWLGPGHTIGFGPDAPDLVPAGPTGTPFSAFLLHPSPPGVPSLQFPPLRGDPITLLWAIPITSSERALSQSQGSGEIVDRLAAAGHTWIHRDRQPVA